MEKYCNLNNRHNELRTELGKHKSKKRSFCAMLKKKRTKIGFWSNTAEDMMSRICSENMLEKRTLEQPLSKSYLSDSILNLRGASENETFISSTEIPNNKNQPLFCDFVKFSPSTTVIKNSGDGFDVNIQVLWCNENDHSICSHCCENSEERYFTTPFFSACTQSNVSNYSSSPTIHSESCLENIILRENSTLQNQSVIMLSDRLSPSKSLPNIFCCNLCPFYYEAGTQIKANRKENSIQTGSTRETSVRNVASPIFSTPANLSAEESFSSVKTHLIPTNKARERNFLYGRTATDSLLGSHELERTLPHRELRVFVGTWNMNGQIPRELNDFLLPPRVQHVSDMIVIGTQETYSEHFEWEVRMQETLGPSHLLFHSAFLGTLHLAVFIRRDLIWFCSVPEDANFCVRPASTFKTKGAVAIGFVIFGSSYLFITSHLTAHMEKVQKRIDDVRRITRALDLPKLIPLRHKSKDVTQNYDYVFWCGDLNFRLSQSREEILQWIAEEKFPLSSPYSMTCDQLTHTILNGMVFRDFQEGPITFPPTYKYDLGSQDFDTSQKQRIPAYTDRILYKQKGRGVLKCLDYTSVQNICTSDHKPVWGLYSSTVRPGIDTIPLAAGLFNREVYLQGIKRRAAGMHCRRNASTVCSIQ